MADTLKNIKKPVKQPGENTDGDKVSRYTKAFYFREKDRKAAEFLKKHPIPGKFLK